MKKWIIFIGLIAILAGLFAYRINKWRSQPVVRGIDEIQLQSGIPVRVFTVESRDLNETIPISGSIKAFVRVSISPKISERISVINVTTGQAVKKGDLLVVLDDVLSKLNVRQAEISLAQAQEQLQKLKNGSRPEEIEMARAAVAQRQADYELKQIEAQRQEKLFKNEATPLQAVQQARAAFDLSKALLEQAKANYELARKGPRQEDIIIAEKRLALAQIALDQAKQTLSFHYLRAPCDGFVSRRMLEPGDIADKNRAIFYLVDTHKVFLELDVSELYLPYIKPDMPVDITIDALPQEKFTGVVREINPIASTADRSYLTRILIDNKAGRLKPGMFGRAEIITGQTKNSLVIPTDALRTAGQDKYVLRVDDKQMARKAIVKTGRIFGTTTEIVSGINVGDKIITLGANVQPGNKVVIAE